MKDRFLPYDKNLKQFSRELRNNSTMGEILLWQEIKGKKIGGYQFLRQKPIGKYIADFYCQALNLVIEVDGYSHFSEAAFLYDQKRDMELRGFDLHVLRLEDSMVKKDMPNALRALHDYIDGSLAHSQSPCPPF